MHLFRASSTIAIFLIASIKASAALVAQYEFNNSLTNLAGAGYALSAVDGTIGGGAPANPFTPTTYNLMSIFGQSRNYLSLTPHQGLNLDVSALPSLSTYTIVIDVRSTWVLNYNKLISLDGGASDNGVYFVNNAITFYPLGDGSSIINPNDWVRVALSYDGNTMNLLYGDNNTFTLANTDTADPYYTLTPTIQFLKDDSDTSYGENYDVDIAGLWVYDTALTLEQIDPATNPTLGIPEPSTALLGGLGLLALVRRRR